MKLQEFILISSRAIDLQKEALNCFPVHHRMHAKVVKELAQTVLLPFTFSQGCHQAPDHSFSLPQEAFKIYRLLKGCGPTASVYLWEASQAWVKDAEEHKHSSVLEAYQTHHSIPWIT